MRGAPQAAALGALNQGDGEDRSGARGSCRFGGRRPRPPRRAAQAAPRRGWQRGLPPASRPPPPRCRGSRPPRRRRRRLTAQSGGETNSPVSCRRQEEPWTPALALPEAAKLWARPGWLAGSSRLASGTGQVAGVWGGGSWQLRSSHLGASQWGPGSGGHGSWVTPSPASPPSPPGGGALAVPLSGGYLPPPLPVVPWSGLRRPP